jgi:ABC-2 type transport system permease protein
MPIISNSYMNVVGSFYSGRFQKSIEELFVSPLSSHVILIGYVMGGVSRAFVVGFVVYIVSLSFTSIPVHNVFLAIFLTLLVSFLFSILGFINAVYAKSFDDINIIPTFVLTPLTYLGGTFYSIYNLPEAWQTVSMFNPIAYMVSAYRYAFIGVEDLNTYGAILLMFILIFMLYSLAIYLLNKGIGVKN